MSSFDVRKILKSSAIYAGGVALVSLGRQFLLLPIVARSYPAEFGEFALFFVLFDLVVNGAAGYLGDYYYKLGCTIEYFIRRFFWTIIPASFFFSVVFCMFLDLGYGYLLPLSLIVFLSSVNALLFKYLYIKRGFFYSLVHNGAKFVSVIFFSVSAYFLEDFDIFSFYVSFSLAAESAVMIFLVFLLGRELRGVGFRLDLEVAPFFFLLSIVISVFVQRIEVYFAEYFFPLDFPGFFAYSSVIYFFVIPFSMLFSVTMSSALASVSEDGELLRHSFSVVKVGLLISLLVSLVAGYAQNHLMSIFYESVRFPPASIKWYAFIYCLFSCSYVYVRVILHRVVGEFAILLAYFTTIFFGFLAYLCVDNVMGAALASMAVKLVVIFLFLGWCVNHKRKVS